MLWVATTLLIYVVPRAYMMIVLYEKIGPFCVILFGAIAIRAMAGDE
ncbi:hypothetical protein [Candidatus Ichthyocystis sparus]|nr:hypothetical protein [Candidatus Ichthyocystis sparus]